MDRGWLTLSVVSIFTILRLANLPEMNSTACVWAWLWLELILKIKKMEWNCSPFYLLFHSPLQAALEEFEAASLSHSTEGTAKDGSISPLRLILEQVRAVPTLSVLLIIGVVIWHLFFFDTIFLTLHTVLFLFHLIRLCNKNNITFNIISKLISAFNFCFINVYCVEIFKIIVFESLASNLPAHLNE